MNLTEKETLALIDRMVAWMREHMNNIGAKQAVVGISGGKDSATVAALCVKAFGKDRVYGVLMPNGNQSDIDFALGICHALDIKHDTLNIAPVMNAFQEILGDSTLISEISRQTQLNLPPRVRMSLLYAVAQSIDGVVINTSNLSEDWVGYATIYGDTTGAFSPLATLTTDEVIQVGKALGIEKRFLVKPPSDGLTGKTDEDVLGFTYEELNTYIRTGIINDHLKEKIDDLHRKSRFKFQAIPMFDSELPIIAEDIANIYNARK